VIKEWLRERSRRKQKRERKMRDVMRADRKFLADLQVEYKTVRARYKTAKAKL